MIYIYRIFIFFYFFKKLFSSNFKTEHVICGSNLDAHNYKILPVRGLEPCGMIIDRPLLPPPAAKGCKICALSKQISPIILGNDFESMATEPMFMCEYSEQSSQEMESGRERKRGSRRREE